MPDPNHPMPFNARITRLVDAIQAISSESPDLAAFLLHTLSLNRDAESIRFQIRLYHDNGPPWQDAPPPLAEYDRRGARMLSTKRWSAVCSSCKWATKAAVTIWWDFDTHTNRYRFETFCYGPKSCQHYTRGPARTVPYSDRMSARDEGFLDELLTEQRGDDE